MTAAFRFDRERHEYTLVETGQVVPHITELLKRSGWVDDEWYTEEGRRRGSAVHDMTAQWDTGAMTTPPKDHPYAPWLMAHIDAMQLLQPMFLAVEQPIVHPQYLYGGRPDRIARFRGVRCVIELKTGAKDKAHRVQTALQAILDAVDSKLPPHATARWMLYLQPTGRWKFEEHQDRRDFDEAYRIIREYVR